MTQISARWVAVIIVFLNRCIGNKLFIHNHYSMAMVGIMQISVGKLYSCERSRILSFL